jgi:YNFM family putative membrane transporter
MKEFFIDKSSAALVTTVTLFPLSLSPIIYGYILERFTAKKILFGAIFILALLELYLYRATDFRMLVLIRFVQGLLIPGILTSIMTFISMSVEKSIVQQVMSYYIAATILGGFLGRFLSGLVAHFIGWRYSFLFLGVSLFVSLFIIYFITDYRIEQKQRLTLHNMTGILKKEPFLNVYITIFCTFYVFASMLNFIPFRLKEISASITELIIGVTYSGYIMGVFVSLLSMKFIKILKSEKRVMLYGLVIYIFSLALFFTPDISLIFTGMFVFCTGMFAVHAVASGYINKISRDNKGITNGLYIAFYYAGGTVGTFLPGYIYKYLGWGAFLFSLLIIMILALVATIKIRQPL